MLFNKNKIFGKVKKGFRKHVIPTPDCAVAWDLCFLKP
jgi:hypothetical protein